ncbi:hypothetical protein X946_4639 [Burkholderia sp. ABCPW 111]|nr:hypothetical protein X946_4639 [Burkholderia sp. ABCPW 111]
MQSLENPPRFPAMNQKKGGASRIEMRRPMRISREYPQARYVRRLRGAGLRRCAAARPERTAARYFAPTTPSALL